MRTSNDIPTARVVNFIHFHGLNLVVVANDGVDYVAVKPLSDLAGLDWRNVKRSMESEDAERLYGLKHLRPPMIAGQGGDITPPGGDITPHLCLHIRIDRAHMYLARINTARMRAHGNIAGADGLLALQVEWANVLHDYETKGAAIKAGVHKELAELMKLRQLSSEPSERKVLSDLIAEKFAAMGCPLPAPAQSALPGID